MPAKIVSDIHTGQGMGVRIIGAHATELIAEAAFAIHMAAIAGDPAPTVHAPT